MGNFEDGLFLALKIYNHFVKLYVSERKKKGRNSERERPKYWLYEEDPGKQNVIKDAKINDIYIKIYNSDPK